MDGGGARWHPHSGPLARPVHQHESRPSDSGLGTASAGCVLVSRDCAGMQHLAPRDAMEARRAACRMPGGVQRDEGLFQRR
eukprot:3099638-Alexandrium_andersonii.AAC.1